MAKQFGSVSVPSASIIKIHVCGSFPERELQVYRDKFWLKVNTDVVIDEPRRFVFLLNTGMQPEERIITLDQVASLSAATHIELSFADANKVSNGNHIRLLFEHLPEGVTVDLYGRPMTSASDFHKVAKAAAWIGDKGPFLRACKNHFGKFLITPKRLEFASKEAALVEWDSFWQQMDEKPFVVKVPGKGGSGLLFVMNHSDLSAAKPIFADPIFPTESELPPGAPFEVLIEEYMTADESLNISFTLREDDGKRVVTNMQMTVENVIEGGHIGNRSLKTGKKALGVIHDVVHQIIYHIIPADFIGNAGIDLYIRRNPFKIVMIMEANPRTNGSSRQVQLAKQFTGWKHVFTDVKELELREEFDANTMADELERMRSFARPFGLQVALYRAFGRYVGIEVIGRKKDATSVTAALNWMIATSPLGQVKYAEKLKGKLSPDSNATLHPTITFYQGLMAKRRA